MKYRNGSLCVRAGIVFAIGLVCFSFNNAFAYSNGAAGYSGANNGTDCGTCHMGGTAPTVALDGPATATPGSVNSYTFTLTGGPGVVAGLGVSASGGTITDTNASGTTIQNGELINSSANMMSMSGGMGSISWTFDWTAPTTAGTYTLYAAGVSADGPMPSGSTGSGGDGVAATTLEVTVAAAANQPPVAAISAPATGVENTDITFDGSGSSDPDGTIASYDWDFGDNTAGSGASVTHAFAAGTYTVTLTVTDDAGATASTTSDLTISAADAPQPPVADAGGPYSATVGDAVQFDGSASSDPDGSIASYEWDFGDGSDIVTGVAPVYTYGTAGTYTVTLTVTDDTGMTATGGTTAEITDVPVVATPTDPPANPPADPPAPVTGETLYNDNCEACHGAGGTGGTGGSIVDESSPEDIMEAISEVPEMQILADTLSADDVDAISAYLRGACDQTTATTMGLREGQDEGTGDQGGSGTDEQEHEGDDDTNHGQGEEGHGGGHYGQGGNDGACVVQQQGPAAGAAPQNALYNQYCASCHGPNGGNVVNSSATDISNAISDNLGGMGSLSNLSQSDIDNIAAYLNSPAITALSASENGGQLHGGAASADSGGGALHWLTLLLGGVWVAIRRKFR